MDHTFCPGAKILRQPAPEMFSCPSCGEEVEIWTDELMRHCLNCGKAVYRDSSMSCLEWCKHGKECVGDDVYDTYMRNKSIGIKRCLLEQIRSYFQDNRVNMVRAKAVLSNAEEILGDEEGEFHIAIPASILLNVDVETARKTLLRLGMSMDDINTICDIIELHRESGLIDPAVHPVLHDADYLVAIADDASGKSEDEIASMIDDKLVTETGRRIARKQLLDAGVGTGSGR